jgi:hypothetical protein
MLISQLRQRIADLEERENNTVCITELERVQSEWETSEDLLRGSQRYDEIHRLLTDHRDNEMKHETIEQYKLYVKVCFDVCAC